MQFDMEPEDRPLRAAKDNDGNVPRCQVLLISQILVRSDEHLKSGRLGYVQQFAILERVPTLLRGRSNDVAFQKPPDRDRR